MTRGAGPGHTHYIPSPHNGDEKVALKRLGVPPELDSRRTQVAVLPLRRNPAIRLVDPTLSSLRVLSKVSEKMRVIAAAS